MTLKEIQSQAINPALSMLPSAMSRQPEKLMTLMLAIGLQESRFKHRRQINGPARGYWQFERGGGVRGVLLHKASRDAAVALCKARGVAPNDQAAYAALERDDVLAAGFARLLLWTDPRPLPELGDADAAWDYYIRNWRPGKPHRETWDALYRGAMQCVLS